MAEKRDDELNRLRQENETLNDQVKLLVQTEQRLYRSQNELDRQLSRIRGLGQFALECSGLDQPEAILDRALRLLIERFDLNHVVAVLDDPTAGRVEVVGRLPGTDRQRWHVERSLAPLSWVARLERTLLIENDPHLGQRFQSVLMPPEAAGHASSPALAVCMPLRAAGGRLLGFVLACRGSRQAASYYRESPEASHLPFLLLLADHLERALQKAALTADLRERGGQLEQANARLQASLENLERTQQELLQAKKMEAVGRLAGGIAHDFNNLLTVILGHAEMLRNGLEPASVERSNAANIVEAGDRAAEIVGHLLAFSRQQKHTPGIVEINEVARGVGRMLARLIGEQIGLDLHIEAGVGGIRADRAHIEQILMNLVINARDAMPDGGRLTIATERRDEAERQVSLVVTDTGHGMSPATCSRIFEPFFTTKGVGRGTGMGLATVYGLVQQNGGEIQVSSEPGRGSRFTVSFPEVDALAEIPVISAERPVPRAVSRATILLAEDEASIRLLFCEVLRAEGYRVIEAEDGQAALARGLEQDPAIDLLICDVVMPRMGGVELVRRLRGERPGVPVLLISGYTFDGTVSKRLPNEPFLQKPFVPSVLLQKVRELLRRRGLRAIPRQGG